MWKFRNFSITQKLREISFWDFVSAKSAILTHLEALNFDFYAFLHFLKAEIYLKMAVLVLLHSLKLKCFCNFRGSDIVDLVNVSLKKK